MNLKVQKIISMFRSSYPRLNVVSVIDYDDLYYIVEAVEDLKANNYNDPFYAIDKRTSKVFGFTPAFDPDKFITAVQHRTLFKVDRRR